MNEKNRKSSLKYPNQNLYPSNQRQTTKRKTLQFNLNPEILENIEMIKRNNINEKEKKRSSSSNAYLRRLSNNEKSVSSNKSYNEKKREFSSTSTKLNFLKRGSYHDYYGNSLIDFNQKENILNKIKQFASDKNIKKLNTLEQKSNLTTNLNKNISQDKLKTLIDLNVPDSINVIDDSALLRSKESLTPSSSSNNDSNSIDNDPIDTISNKSNNNSMTIPSKHLKLSSKIDLKLKSFNSSKQLNESNFNNSDIQSLKQSNMQSKLLISQSQKRRGSYINYRKGINSITQSRQTSIFQFRTIQSAVEKSYIKSSFQHYKDNKKKYEYILSILSIINIVLSLIDTQLYILRFDKYKSDETIMMFEKLTLIQNENISVMENILRYIMLFISLSMGVVVILKYKSILLIKKTQKALSAHDNIISSGLYKSFLIEFCISLIFYPPNFNGIYTSTINEYVFIIIINAIFSLLTILKIFHLFEIIKYFSLYQSFDSMSICNKYNVKSDILFSFKAYLQSRPSLFLSIFFVFFMLFTSFSLRTFEIGVFINDDFLTSNNLLLSSFKDLTLTSKVKGKGTVGLDHLANSLWFIIQTITTVGYGDAYPRTHFGRSVTAFTCIIGIFLLSLLTLSLSKYIQFTSDENKAYLTIKQKKQEKEIKQRAHSVIYTFLQINKLKRINSKEEESKLASTKRLAFEEKLKSNVKNEKENKMKMQVKTKKEIERIGRLTSQFVLLAKLKKDISNFRLEDKTSSKYSPLDEILLKMRKKLNNDLSKLEMNINQLSIFNNQFSELKSNHMKNEERLNQILEHQKSVYSYILSIYNKNYERNIEKVKKMNKRTGGNKEIKEIKIIHEENKYDYDMYNDKDNKVNEYNDYLNSITFFQNSVKKLNESNSNLNKNEVNMNIKCFSSNNRRKMNNSYDNNLSPLTLKKNQYENEEEIIVRDDLLIKYKNISSSNSPPSSCKDQFYIKSNENLI